VPTDLKRILLGPLAVGSVFPLVLLVIRLALAISMTLIAFSGAMAAPNHMQAVALIARAVPDVVRAQVMGLTSTSLVTVQGSASCWPGRWLKSSAQAPPWHWPARSE
jgi:hypothetical protein